MQNHFLRRVCIKNYKSIAACNVELKAPLAILVGPNGSGKSNFLDALRLISDSLNTTLEQALLDRGGVKDVRRRPPAGGGRPSNFGVRVDFALRSDRNQWGFFAFEIKAISDSSFVVSRERFEVFNGPMLAASYDVVSKRETPDTNLSVAMPPVLHDRLYLTNAGSIEPFNEVFESLRSMGFYNLNPGVIRQLQHPDPGTLLNRDGRNLASVLGNLKNQHPDVKRNIEKYLQNVVPGIESVGRRSMREMETVEFRQIAEEQASPWHFSALNMSDGTLRALGVLVALLQTNTHTPSVVGIEEPEMALHPAASGVLWDAIQEASQRTQVLATSHSADLLDLLEKDKFPSDFLLSVISEDRKTVIGPLKKENLSVLKKELCLPGELLRQGVLEPDEESRERARSAIKLEMFSTGTPCAG